MSVRSNITGPFAEITVGAASSAVVFNLPKELLCKSSTYFTAALNNGFSETTTQRIVLDDDDPVIFRTYAIWLFQEELERDCLDEVAKVQRHLFHLYIFADKRGIAKLANDVVTMMASYWDEKAIDMSVTQECLPLVSSQCTLYRLTLDSLLLESRDAVTGPTAQIIVGSGRDIQEFSINKKLLCNSSTYFKAALTNGFAETHDQKITLDDESPAIFRTYVLWLYQMRLYRDAMPEDDQEVQRHMLELYVFADKRGITNLANDTITMLASRWSIRCVDLDDIEWLFSLISRRSKLYQLLVDKLLLELREDTESESRFINGDLPRIALIDLVRRSESLTTDFNTSEACFESVCHYHIHGRHGAVSQGECIGRIEAGHNVFYPDIDLDQREWDWD
ncbi:hypothetical protein KCU61_g8279, partial [Aureobasidium melanogenum]